MRLPSELFLGDIRALGLAATIVAILFTFNIVTTDAQDPELEELQSQ